MSSLAPVKSALKMQLARIRRLARVVRDSDAAELRINQLKQDIALLEAFQALPKAIREKVISTDTGLFNVGVSNSHTRDEQIRQALEKVPAGSRLLDAGAGECQYRTFCSHLNYVSQDIAVYDGSGDKGLQTGTWDTSQIDIVCDIVDVPEPDASFDAVLCTEVLEHLPDPVRALDEMARLLKPGGTMIVSAPFWSLTHFAPFHFATGFNRYFYEHHFGRLGFSIVEMSPNGNYFESVAQEVRRIPEIGMKFADDKALAIERHAICVVLSMLERMAAKDHGSTELLAFGMLVRAVKDRP